EEEKAKRAKARKLDVRMVVSTAAHAAGMLASAVSKGDADTPLTSSRIKAAANRLRQALDRELVVNLMDDLEPQDRGGLLMNIQILSSLVNFCEVDSVADLSRDDVKN